MIVSLEKKRRQLNENTLNENIDNVSQSDISLNENPTGNTFNNEATTIQGPMGDDDKIESWKVWMMEMLMNDGNISRTMANRHEQANGEHKKFLYARATHSNHAIQYHMQQIMERQVGVDKQKYDGEWNGFDPFGVKFIQTLSSVHFTHHSYDRRR